MHGLPQTTIVICCLPYSLFTIVYEFSIMISFYKCLLLFLYSNVLKADTPNKDPTNFDSLSKTGEGKNLFSSQKTCYDILELFADYASNFTKCTILNARPIRICEKCIGQYLDFSNKYQELLSTVDINGTSCKSLYISNDRLDAILETHDNIMNIWNKGHCNACYDWTNSTPVLSDETKHFNEKYDVTSKCIKRFRNESIHNTTDEFACGNCSQSYLQLDSYYKTLSEDAIGVDSICMDIVDLMNATRSMWSKTLKCCVIRKTPEIIFLCCTGIISALPICFYLVLRFCSPMRDLPNVLKQSRFKQTILRSFGRTN